MNDRRRCVAVYFFYFGGKFSGGCLHIAVKEFELYLDLKV